MHAESMQAMTGILNRWPSAHVNLLDVGSLDVNGSYREMVEGRGWQYTGLDIVPGRNVDVCSADPYHFPFADGAFDVVISGSAMEHVQNLWLWTPELARLVRPAGLLVIITHVQWTVNHHRPDCWRILPDGMQFLFDQTGALEKYEIRLNNQERDIVAVARKKR